MTYKTFDGVEAGDIGAKCGWNGLDNGYEKISVILIIMKNIECFSFVFFRNYRIPRENLLNKHGDVLPDGTYKTPFKVITKVLN